MADKTLAVRYTADTKSYEAGLARMGKSTASFDKAVSKTAATGKSASSKLGDSIKKTVGGSIPLDYAAAGLAAAAFVKSAIDAYADHEKALQQLKSSFANAPQIVDKSTTAIEEQATALQKLTGFQDEEVIRADAVIARFGATKAQIATLNPLILDYARTTGVDAASAAQSIGKALLGNAKALKGIGIQFKATGDRAQDLATITELLQAKVGGAAEAFGKTFAGQMLILNAELDDFKETIGKAIIPVLTEFAGSLTTVVGVVQQLTDLLPGDNGLGQLLSRTFDASPIGIASDAIGAAGDLLKGHFTDAAKGAANALIPFWDPFTKSTDDATKAAADAMDSISDVDSVARRNEQTVSAMADAWARSSDSTRAARVELLKVKDPTRVATDKISGLSIELYDADAALRAFNHSIDVYLGKIAKGFGRAGAGGRVALPGQTTHFQAGGVTRGGLSLVGEAGPELRMDPPGVRYWSHDDTTRMIGGTTVNVYGTPARELDEAKLVRLLRRQELLRGRS